MITWVSLASLWVLVAPCWMCLNVPEAWGLPILCMPVKDLSWPSREEKDVLTDSATSSQMPAARENLELWGLLRIASAEAGRAGGVWVPAKQDPGTHMSLPCSVTSVGTQVRVVPRLISSQYLCLFLPILGQRLMGVKLFVYSLKSLSLPNSTTLLTPLPMFSPLVWSRKKGCFFVCSIGQVALQGQS